MYTLKRSQLIIAVALLLGTGVAIPHAGMKHVMGTVAAVTDHFVIVQTVQHTKVTVLIDPSTKFSNNNGQASLRDLKVGDRVVIHATPDSQKRLVGVEVKWSVNSSGQR